MTTPSMVRSGFTTLAALIIFFFGLTALPQPAMAVGAVTDANMALKSAEAKTKADYEALAEYFREKAVEAGKTVERHERMFRGVTTGGGGKGHGSMRPHCRALIRSAREAQEAYEDVAEEYSRLAKEAAE